MSSTSIANTALNPADILRAPNYVNTAVLSSGVGQAFDVPAGCQFVFFGANCDFHVKYGSTAAALPTSSLSTGSGNEINPTARNIGSSNATTGLSVITGTTGGGFVTMSWYTP